MVSIVRLSVVNQSSFGLPGQYGRRVIRVNGELLGRERVNEEIKSISTRSAHGFFFPCQNTDAAGRDNLRRKQYRANEDGPKPKETFRTWSPQFPVGKIQCSLHTKLSEPDFGLGTHPLHEKFSSMENKKTRKELMTASYNRRIKTAYVS